MGFFSEAFKHPGWYAGGILPGLVMNNFGQPESNPALPYRRSPPKTADEITLDGNLAKVLGSQGAGPQNKIAGAYGGARDRFATESKARGVRPGSYAPERFGQAEDLSNLGLKTGLEGILGDTGYKNYQSERGFGENMDLAQLTGELNKPSTLEEVLGALSGAAHGGGQIAGALGRRRSSGTPYTSSSTPDYSRYMSGGSGLNLY